MDFIERKIVIGMVVSEEFLSNISGVYNSDLLQSKVSQKIANWCMSFYRKHSKAPNKEIEDFVYILKKEKGITDDDLEDVVTILDSLSKEYDENSFNISYLTEEAFKYFSINSIENTMLEIKDRLDKGDIEGIKRTFTNYNIIEKPQAKGISPFDMKEIANAFVDNGEGVFSYDGAIGDLLNCEFYEESFFAYLAPAKRGKTWLLMDNAITALKDNKNVAFFQAGDMSQSQFLRRFHTSLTKRNYKERYNQEHWSPVPDCVHNQTGQCNLEFKENKLALFEMAKEKDIYKKTKEEIVEALELCKDYHTCNICQNNCKNKYAYRGTVAYQKVKQKEPLTLREIDRFIKWHFPNMFDKLKLSTHSTDSLSCNIIRTQLDSWAKYDNFTPKVVVIDYADIMKADGRFSNKKEKSSDIFINLRKLSQDYKLCLITATQADAEAMSKESLSAMNFCDDVDKLKHLTALVALNQTGLEKEKGILRLSKILTRDEESNIDKQVKVLQNLWIGKPVLKSYY